MELTTPRSPTISRAIDAYVVSEVTTLTGAAGGVVAERPKSSWMKDIMSVGLVFVGTDSPDRLERELVRRGRVRDPLPLVLRAQEDPLALPHRERGNHLARDHTEGGRFDVVVAHAGDEPLVQLVRRTGVATEPGRARARNLLLQGQQLAAQRPFVVHRAQRRPPRQTELESAHARAQRRVGIRAVEPGPPDLHVRGAPQLPEVEQVHEVRRPAAVPEQLGITGAARYLRRELVGAQPAERAVDRQTGAGQAVPTEIARHHERVLGLGHGVEVPAVQLAELLPEPPEVDADAAGHAGPIRVALLETGDAVFDAHEDLGMRVGIEGRLESDFELPRHEVIALHARRRRVRAHVAGYADLWIELGLVALAADELRRHGIGGGAL